MQDQKNSDRTALLDAAALAERLSQAGDYSQPAAEALRLLARHARASSAETEAWKRLVTRYREAVRGVSLRDDALDSIDEAEAAIRALGIDPATGEHLATEVPR